MKHRLYQILEKLDVGKIYYTLGRYRDDVITIHVSVPGCRYEIDVEEDGTVSTSTFKGSESSIEGLKLVDKIIKEYKD